MRPIGVLLFLFCAALYFAYGAANQNLRGGAPQAGSVAYLPNTYQNKSLYAVSRELKEPGRKKAVMVFASWCSACKTAMPYYINLSNKIGVPFYALSIDQDEDSLEAFVEKQPQNKIRWVRVVNRCTGGKRCSGLSGAFKSFGMNYAGKTPTYAIFDGKGQVTHQNPSIAGIRCAIEGTCR